MRTTMRRKGSGDGGPPSAHRVARDALLAEIKATPLDDDARAIITRIVMMPVPTAVGDARAVLERAKQQT